MLLNYALIRAFNAFRSGALFSVRSLAKSADIGVSTSKRCVDYLLKQGFLNKSVVGRTHQLSLNDDFVVRSAKRTASLIEIRSSGILEEIGTLYHDVVSVVLFGSVAKGSDSADSDIDLLIICRSNCKKNSFKSEKKLGRELSVMFTSYSDWRKKAKSDKAFYDEVIIHGVALYGELPVVR